MGGERGMALPYAGCAPAQHWIPRNLGGPLPWERAAFGPLSIEGVGVCFAALAAASTQKHSPQQQQQPQAQPPLQQQQLKQPPEPAAEVASPAVLPSLPSHHPATLPLARFMQGPLAGPPAPVSYVAGPEGALVMVCPPPKPPSDAASVASVGESELQHSLSPAAAEEGPPAAGGEGKGPGQPADREGREEQRQQSTGRPLHRVKSRRRVAGLLRLGSPSDPSKPTNSTALLGLACGVHGNQL
jgi:hypothetical protein